MIGHVWFLPDGVAAAVAVVLLAGFCLWFGARSERERVEAERRLAERLRRRT